MSNESQTLGTSDNGNPDPNAPKTARPDDVGEFDAIHLTCTSRPAATEAPLPDWATKPQSKTPASCGRLVHVYSNRWIGPRPGLVTQAWGISGTHQLINVTVVPDGCNDREWAIEHGRSNQGTSLGSVGLYDPLTPEERSALICGPGASAENNPPRYHCEWMPFQAGQAKRTETAEGDLSKRLAAAEAQLAKATVALSLLAKSSAFNLKATDPALHQALSG